MALLFDVNKVADNIRVGLRVDLATCRSTSLGEEHWYHGDKDARKDMRRIVVGHKSRAQCCSDGDP